MAPHRFRVRTKMANPTDHCGARTRSRNFAVFWPFASAVAVPWQTVAGLLAKAVLALPRLSVTVLRCANIYYMRLLSFTAFSLSAQLSLAAYLMGADVIEFRSGVPAASLLELYTSEGCSSCPPAEAWLSRLKESPKLWIDVVPVAFHVDYWDSLGWRDPFGSEANSNRQRAYAHRWRSSSVYTPGFVLDGKEWGGWSTGTDLPSRTTKRAGVLVAQSANVTEWMIRFVPIPGTALSRYNFTAALLGFDQRSTVKAGENRGKILVHDFVVLALASAAAKQAGDTAQTTVTVDGKILLTPKQLGLAVWVTRSDGSEPLQAVGGWLSSTRHGP